MNVRFVPLIVVAVVCLALPAAAAASAPPGELAWLQTWSPPAGTETGGKSVLQGPGGDLWVGASIFKTWTSSDIVVMRYSSTGQRRWVKRIDLAGDEYYGDMAVDRYGNTFVAGAVIRYKNSKEIDQWRVIKISRRGRILWVKKRPMSAVPGGERAWDVVTDAAGNAYVAGEVARKGISTFAVVKYTPGGRTAWVRTRTVQDEVDGEARAIAIDAAGRVYAAGQFSVAGDNVGFASTARYSPNGHLDWHAEYRGFADSADHLYDVDVSKAGVAVAGSSSRAGSSAGLVLVYGLGGELKVQSLVPYWLGRSGLRWESVDINSEGQVAVGGASSGAGGKSYFAMATLNGPGDAGIRVMDHDPVGALTGVCRAVVISFGGSVFGTGSYSNGSVHPLFTYGWDHFLPSWSVDYGTRADGLDILLVSGGVVVTGSDDDKLVLAWYGR